MRKKFTYTVLLLGIIAVFYPTLLKQERKKSYTSFIQNVYKAREVTPCNQESDNPDMAYLMDYIQTFDPNNQSLPKDRLFRALEHLEKSTVSRTNDDLTWKNIPSDMSGRIRDIAFDPSDSEHKKIWAAAATGGLWYNDDISDANSPWNVVSDVWSNLSISKIIFDPQDPLTMYVGTGESYTAVNIYRESSGVGNGIWKSEDGGTSWKVLSSSTNFSYINDMAIRIEDGISVIYAAVVSGIYKGATFGESQTNGLHRSIDGGITWTQVLPNIDTRGYSYSPSDIEVAGEKILVGTMRNTNEEGAGVILTSTDGISWSVNTELADSNFDINNGLYAGRVIIKAAPTNPEHIYSIVSGGYKNESGWIRDHGDHVVLYHSLDGGSRWNALPTPPTEGWGSWANIPWHALALAVDPNNENTLVITAQKGYKLRIDNLPEQPTAYDWDIVCSSKFPQSDQEPDFVHTDHHAVVFKPGSSEEIVLATDGGVFYSKNFTNSDNENIGSSNNIFPNFEDRNKKLNTLQFYAVAVDYDESKNHVLGGLQDNGSVKYNRADPLSKYSLVSGGDGTFCFFDSNQSNIEITSSYNNFWIVSFNGTDRLLNYDYLSGLFINPAIYNSSTNQIISNAMGLAGDANVADVNHPDEALIMRISSTGFSSSYKKLGTGTTMPYTAMRLSPFANNGLSDILIGTMDGELFFVKNVDSNPNSVEVGNDEFPIGNISSVAFGENENELMVTFSNYGVSSIWHTIDQGVNWKEIEGNLPDIPVRWVEFHPTDFSKAYVATEIGVWYTEDLDKPEVSWTKSSGLPNVRVDMIQIRSSDGKMVAATHGRGLFETEIEVPDVIASSADCDIIDISLFPNPVSNNLKLETPNKINQGSIYDLQGRKIKNVIFHQNEVDVSYLKKGIYLLEFKSKGKILRKKFLKN